MCLIAEVETHRLPSPYCLGYSLNSSVQGAAGYFLTFPNVTKGQVQVYFVCFLADMGLVV